MLEHSMVEKLFREPIREVFCGPFFNYSVLLERPSFTSYEICLSLDNNKSPFIHELERHGIKIDMRMLDFNMDDRSYGGISSNIKMTISDAKTRTRKAPVIWFDSSATALLLDAHRTGSTADIKEYLIDRIREAINSSNKSQ